MTTILSPIFGDFDTREKKVINKEGVAWARRFFRDGIPLLLPMITLQILEQYPSYLSSISLICVSIIALIWVDVHLPAMIGRKQYEDCCSLYKPSLAFSFWVAVTNLIATLLGFSGFLLMILSGSGGVTYLNYVVITL